MPTNLALTDMLQMFSLEDMRPAAPCDTIAIPSESNAAKDNFSGTGGSVLMTMVNSKMAAAKSIANEPVPVSEGGLRKRMWKEASDEMVAMTPDQLRRATEDYEDEVKERQVKGPKGRASRKRPVDESTVKVFTPPLGNGSEEFVISPKSFLEYREDHPMPTVAEFEASKRKHIVKTADVLKKQLRGDTAPHPYDFTPNDVSIGF
jgi:hypothetical protein